MVHDRRAIVVIGLAYGDCGKGSISDFLTRRFGAHTVVRFNGGPQAAHNVVTSDGRHHTFSQFGSGTFVPGVKTLLSRFMLIEPYAVFNEAAHLRQIGAGDALKRLVIDARCPIITPPHQAANRIRELVRGEAAHGTCGMGVGEAVEDLAEHPPMMLHAGELADRATVARKLRAIRDLKMDHLREVIPYLRAHPKAGLSITTLIDPSWIDAAVDNYAALARQASVADEADIRAMLREPGVLLFEGAQGVLLDELFGFHPNTTWSTTTFANAEKLLSAVDYDGRRMRIGVLRTYFTRHGAGPLVTEESSLRASLSERHNTDEGWQGRFRMGVFDAVAARYAIAAAGGIDALAITHLDRLTHLPPKICVAYQRQAPYQPADDCFELRAGDICDIRLRKAGPSEMEPITRRLSGCRPVQVEVRANDPRAFVDLVESELRCRVGIKSFGPTAAEKQLCGPCHDL